MNLLGDRAFARLWTASLFSEMAEWILQVALPVFIYQVTGSAGATALTMVAGLLPTVVLSPVAGVLADRWDRRALLCAICFGQALVALPLLAGGLSPIYFVMFAQAALASLFEPARAALVPALVGVERLTAANGLMGMNTSLARLIGSSLGGFVLGFAGLGWVVAMYLLLLLAAAGLLLARFADFPVRAVERESPWRSWLDGFAEIARNRRLRVVSGMLALFSIGQGMFVVLFVVFVTETLRGGEAGTGLLRGVQAIGGIAAGLALTSLVSTRGYQAGYRARRLFPLSRRGARPNNVTRCHKERSVDTIAVARDLAEETALTSVARRLTPVNLLSWGTIAFGLVAAVVWNAVYVTTSFGVFVGLFIVVGVPIVVLNAGLSGVVQAVTPQERLGRVLATLYAGSALFQVAGMLGAGALAGWAGPAVLLNAQAALGLAAGVLALIGLRRAVATVEECPVSSPPATSM
jgi:MFS family permease